MDFQSIVVEFLFKKETATAWVGIVIGKAYGRNKGVGSKALIYLEEQIKAQGLKRVELGVFAFNKPALKLYKKNGYKEFGRIKAFTFWKNKMWTDIRLEKYLSH